MPNKSRASVSDIMPFVTTGGVFSGVTRGEITVLTIWELMLDTWGDSVRQFTTLPVLPAA